MKKSIPWIWCNDDFYSNDWLLECLPDNGIFCKDWSDATLDIIRFPEDPHRDCPKCSLESLDHYIITKGEQIKCCGCGHKFSTTSGTHISDTKLELYYWDRIAYLLGDLKFPINSVLVARDLGVTQKTSYQMLINIKNAFGINKDGILYTLPKSISSYNILEKLLTLR